LDYTNTVLSDQKPASTSSVRGSHGVASRKQRSVGRGESTYVSKEYVAATFRIEEYARVEKKMKQESSACYMLHAGLLRGILFAHEKGSEIFLRNFI
jgi:hypothetical protein